jgi:hypothetical protein
MVCVSENHASEIEIFTFGRGLPDSDFTWQRAKKAFSPANEQAVGRPDFINRIGQ